MSHYYTPTGSLVDPWTPGALPSPSTILDIIKNDGIQAFISRVGEEVADEHMRNAQERGTRVHLACELWANNHGDPESRERAGNIALLQDGDWAYLDGFINWWETFSPELVATEAFLINRTLRYAGTCDLIVRLDGQLWLIDIKTGVTRVKHGLQVKFYQEAWKDMVKDTPDVQEPMRMAGLYLDAKRACGYRYFKSEHGILEYTEPLASIKAHIAVYRWWAKKEGWTVKPKERDLQPWGGQLEAV